MSAAMATGNPGELSENPRPRRLWALILLAVLLWHAAVLWLGREAGGWLASLRAPILPPPAEVVTLTPDRVEALRQQWKKRSLLLEESNAAKRVDEAPEDARYFSDKNARAEKEQRAERMTNRPAPVGNDAQGENAADAAKSGKKSTLDSLGVPLTPGPGPRAEKEEKRASSPSRQGRPDGGSQYLEEDELPTGAETMLNAATHPGYSYMRRMRDEIVPRWEFATNQWQGKVLAPPGNYVTEARITIDRRGNVVRVEYPVLSGIRELDAAVDQAIGRFDRFPNPPAAIFEGEETFTSTWSFTVTVSQGGPVRWAPPRRAR